MRASPPPHAASTAGVDRRSRTALVVLVAFTVAAFVWLVATLAAAAF